MKRICHIRSEKDYFLKKNYKKDFSSNEIFSEWENEVDLFLNIWNSEFCINYMEFRKLIRNTVINYIKNQIIEIDWTKGYFKCQKTVGFHYTKKNEGMFIKSLAHLHKIK